MPTIVKTPFGRWKTVIREQGWPTLAKTFRMRGDVECWSRCAGYGFPLKPSETLSIITGSKSALFDMGEVIGWSRSAFCYFSSETSNGLSDAN